MKMTLTALIALGLLTGCASLQSGRTNTCINNMRMLDAATEQCAMADNLKDGDQAPRDSVSEYIKNGIDSLRCPSGGGYTSGIVGTEPECSVHGTLTQAWVR